MVLSHNFQGMLRGMFYVSKETTYRLSMLLKDLNCDCSGMGKDIKLKLLEAVEGDV